MIGVLIGGKQAQYTGKTLCDDRGRDWNDTPTSRGTPRIASRWEISLPCWLSGEEPAGQCRTCGSFPGSGRSLGGGSDNPSGILAWETHGQRSLLGNSPWGLKRVGHTWVAKQQSFQRESPADTLISGSSPPELWDNFYCSKAPNL